MTALESFDEELKRVQQMHQVCLYNFKDRTECFDDYYFPCRKRDNCKLEHHVSNWMMNQFVYMHNRMLIKGKIK